MKRDTANVEDGAEARRAVSRPSLVLSHKIDFCAIEFATSVLVLKAFERRRPNILPALTHLLRRKASLPRSPIYLTLSIKRR